MKTKNQILSALTVLLLAVGFLSCSKADPFKVGSHCGAKWSDGSYWGATITGNTGGKYQVKYDDGTSGEVTMAELKANVTKDDIKAGDKVIALWSQTGKMYNGSVQDVQATGATIKWDDGSSPTLVAFNNICK